MIFEKVGENRKRKKKDKNEIKEFIAIPMGKQFRVKL